MQLTVMGSLASVRDLDRSIAFYQEVAQLTLKGRSEGIAALLLDTSPRHQVLVLRQAEGTTGRSGRNSLGVRTLMFELETTDELDAIETRLTERKAMRLRKRSERWEVVTGYDPDRTEIVFSVSLTGSPIAADDWQHLDALLYSLGD